MWLLTIRDLQYRAARFMIVVIATSLVFALLMVMSGLVDQLSNEAGKTIATFHTRYWILPAGASSPFTATSALAESSVQSLSIGDAQPILIGRSVLRIKDKTKEVIIVGHSIGGLGMPHIVKGRAPQEADQVALDETSKLTVGDTAHVGAHDYRVTGLTRDTTILAGLPFVFMDIAEAQRLIYQGRPVISAILTNEKPASLPASAAARTAEEVIRATRQPLEKAVQTIDLIRALLWVVAGMIIGGVIYLSSMERRRDFAVLKAIGADSRPLLGGLAVQGVFVALSASAIAAAMQLVLTPAFPIRVHVSIVTLLEIPALAVAISLLASAAGMRQVAKVDPALSFA
ncbi:MAG: hypothetical protein NVSMB57_12840 [Actinomycetota bacterium]